jgi:hypothetical protein
MKGRRQVSGMSILMIVVTSLVVPLFAYQDSYAYPTVYPTGTTIYEVGKTFNGYTLFRIKVPNRILLIDMDGEVVHSWEHGNQFMQWKLVGECFQIAALWAGGVGLGREYRVGGLL